MTTPLIAFLCHHFHSSYHFKKYLSPQPFTVYLIPLYESAHVHSQEHPQRPTRPRSHFFFTRSTDYERDSDKLHQHTMSFLHPLQGKWVANYKRAGMVLLDNNHPGKGKRKLLATAQRERHKVQSNYLRWITSLLAYLRPSNQPTNVATAATQR